MIIKKILSGINEIEEFIKEVLPPKDNNTELDIDRTSIKAIDSFREDLSIQIVAL